MGQNDRQRRATTQRRRANARRDRATPERPVTDPHLDPEPRAGRVPAPARAGPAGRGRSAVRELGRVAVPRPLDPAGPARGPATARPEGDGHAPGRCRGEVTTRHASQLVHPRWQGQLDLIGAVRRPAGGSSASGWARRAGLEWPAARSGLLTVLAVLSILPPLNPVLPAPGTSTGHTGTVQGVDEKVLRRVRGLLAKAESTEHPDEADAFNANAQELMARYSIERAMAESTDASGSEPVCRRLWLANPYFDAKASLVGAVATANNCRAVQTPEWGFVALVGHAGDLDAVDLLATGLLVQATRATALTGPQVSRSGVSQTRSFRRAFLLSYARRIGERLSEAVHDTSAAYDADHGGALVPVLTARRRAVEDKVGDLYPDLVSRRISISNRSGWGAGRAAADLARLDVRNTITHAG